MKPSSSKKTAIWGSENIELLCFLVQGSSAEFSLYFPLNNLFIIKKHCPVLIKESNLQRNFMCFLFPQRQAYYLSVVYNHHCQRTNLVFYFLHKKAYKILCKMQSALKLNVIIWNKVPHVRLGLNVQLLILNVNNSDLGVRGGN